MYDFLLQSNYKRVSEAATNVSGLVTKSGGGVKAWPVSKKIFPQKL